MSSVYRKLPLSLHEHVIDELGGRIVRGEIKGDEVLPIEDDLAESFGVSRTVVREAIKVLVHKHLLEVRTRTGTRVLRPYRGTTSTRISFAGDLPARSMPSSCRMSLNCGGLWNPPPPELAAARATPGAVRAIEAALHDMATTTDVNAHHAGRPSLPLVHSGSRGKRLAPRIAAWHRRRIELCDSLVDQIEG